MHLVFVFDGIFLLEKNYFRIFWKVVNEILRFCFLAEQAVINLPKFPRDSLSYTAPLYHLDFMAADYSFFCTLYLFHFMHNHLDLLFTLHQWWITTSLHYCCFRISVTFILQSRLGSDLMTFPFRAKFLQGLFLFTNTFSFCKDFLFAKTFSFYKYVFFLQIRFLFAKTFSFYRYVFCLQIFYFSNSLKRLWRLSLWSSFCKEDSYQRRKCQKNSAKLFAKEKVLSCFNKTQEKRIEPRSCFDKKKERKLFHQTTPFLFGLWQ